ncbi:MAG: alkaline shock response membrane anchor protein AmaP [Anaerolineae bacterium]
MNTFNRIIMVLAIILALVTVASIMARPLEAVELARLGLQYFEEGLFDEQFFYIFLGVAAGIELILLILLWLELRKRTRDSVQVDIEGGGRAKLSTSSIAQSLEYRIDELPGVREVKPKIKSRGKDLDVVIDLDTTPPVNVPVLSAKVVDLCRDILEGQLGVKIHNKVQVNVKHEPYPRGTMPSTEPFGKEEEEGKTVLETPGSEEREEKEAETAEPEPASTGQEEGGEEETSNEETASDKGASEISTDW